MKRCRCCIIGKPHWDPRMPNSELPPEPPSSEITPQPLYNARREFVKNAGFFALAAGSIGAGLTWLSGQARPTRPVTNSDEWSIAQRSDMAGGEEQSTYESATTYNNYYEFGTDKSDPANNAH